MRALPIDCQKNIAVCLEEIMKELTQVRFEVNILAENRTSLRCEWDILRLLVFIIPSSLNRNLYYERQILQNGESNLCFKGEPLKF